MKKKTVKITIKTQISDLGAVNIMEKVSGPEMNESLLPEDEIIEYSTEAVLYDHGEAFELSYDESTDMGMKDTHTTIVFSKSEPDCVNLKREGENRTSLFFSPDHPRQNCAYNSGGYTFEFVTVTRKVVNTVTEKGGNIEIDYTMEVFGTKTQRNRIFIKVDEIKNN